MKKQCISIFIIHDIRENSNHLRKKNLSLNFQSNKNLQNLQNFRKNAQSFTQRNYFAKNSYNCINYTLKISENPLVNKTNKFRELTQKSIQNFYKKRRYLYKNASTSNFKKFKIKRHSRKFSSSNNNENDEKRVLKIYWITPKVKRKLKFQKGEKKTYKIDCDDKIFPLSFEIKGKEFCIQTFFSFKYSNPSEQSNDLEFGGNNFEIKKPLPFCQNSRKKILYVTFQSLIIAEFLVSFRFYGENKIIPPRKYREDNSIKNISINFEDYSKFFNSMQSSIDNNLSQNQKFLTKPLTGKFFYKFNILYFLNQRVF